MSKGYWLHFSSSSPIKIAFTTVHVAQPLSQPPVVRSERSSVDKLMRFAFATTYQVAQHSARTY